MHTKGVWRWVSFSASSSDSDSFPIIRLCYIVNRRSVAKFITKLFIAPSSSSSFIWRLLLLENFSILIRIDLVKFLLRGRDDLSYPLMLKADYVVLDPRENGSVFVIYTILSRIYINCFLMEFYTMDLFFFYIAGITKGVKFGLQLLSRGSDLHVLNEMEKIQRSREIIDDRSNH